MDKQQITGKTRRELVASIIERIKAGEDRKIIFNDLTTKYKDQNLIATLIANIPNPSDAQELKKGSLFVISTLCIYAALHIISILSAMSPLITSYKGLIFVLPMMFIWPAFAIWAALQVKQNRGSSYRFAGLLCIVFILNNLRGMKEYQLEDVVSWALSIVIIVILIIASYISFKIKKKYFPHLAYYGAKKENINYILGR